MNEEYTKHREEYEEAQNAIVKEIINIASGGERRVINDTPATCDGLKKLGRSNQIPFRIKLNLWCLTFRNMMQTSSVTLYSNADPALMIERLCALA